MRDFSIKHILAAIVAMVLLSACGQESETAETSDGATDTSAAQEANTETNSEAAAQIEARQAQYKKLGAAFKTINDQLKAGTPDVAAIQAAAASIPVETAGMMDWFPEGTGPEAGVETEALPAIWENRADFDQKIADFQAAAANLNTIAEGGDLAAIGAAFGATGGTCKACHDNYRLDD